MLLCFRCVNLFSSIGSYFDVNPTTLCKYLNIETNIIRSCLRWQHFWSGNAVFFILRWEFVLVDFKWQTSFEIFEVLNSLVFKIYESSQGNQVDNQTWFDATLVYRFNECNRRSYNSQTQRFDTLSNAFIRGDLNAATRDPFIWSLISGLFSDEV